jgi:regulator of protease activity HflC (stomatin/prohibitin superfamily)
MVEMKDVEIPVQMQRAMAQEAQAQREARARIIKAQAEYDASTRLTEAATLIAEHPLALELRRMQMITEVGAEQNTTTILMLPTEFVTAAEALGNAFAKQPRVQPASNPVVPSVPSVPQPPRPAQHPEGPPAPRAGDEPGAPTEA